MKIDDHVMQSAMAITHELLTQPGVEASDRFIELFGELVAVAASARLTYGESALNADDIAKYLDLSFVFFNSLRHA